MTATGGPGATRLRAVSARAAGPADGCAGIDDAPTVVAQLHAAREQIRELERAVESHRVVGQACGVLMALHRIDDRRAFAALQRVSMEHQVRLREVAEALRGLIASEVLVPESPAVRAAMLLLPGSSHPAAV